MNELWTTVLFPIIEMAGLLFLFFTIKNLLPSYFSEKGKNLATKEDVATITTLVEEVKHSFTKETENLKANLQFLTNVQVGIAVEERTAIIDINLKYFRWLNLLVDSSMNNINSWDDKELDKHLATEGEYYRELVDSETKFRLFVGDVNLVKSLNNLKIETLKKLAPHMSDCIHDLRENNLDLLKVKTLPAGEQSAKRAEIMEQRKGIKNELRTQITTNFGAIIDLAVAFQKLGREHIYKLISKEEKK